MMSKCSSCFGYGLWAVGDATPMGSLDATDGYPTLPCPECGADYNGEGTTPRKSKQYSPHTDTDWWETLSEALSVERKQQESRKELANGSREV